MSGENPQTTMPPVPREPLIDRNGQMSSQWTRWMQQIQRVLSFSGGIAWGIINKASSKLSDIETRTHAMLQSILGTGDRHITADENSEITALYGLAAGMVAKTGDAAYSARSIQGTTNEIGVSFGDGMGGNPTVFLPDVIEGPRMFGTDIDHTLFEADGTEVSVGAATTWNDINKSLLPLSTGANVPPIIAVNGAAHLKVRAFNGTATLNELGEGLEILHDYKEGSDITPHIHWAATDTTVGNVKWQLAYIWINRDGTFTGETVINVTVATTGTAWKEQRTNFPTISGTGMQIGSRFQFTIFRDPSDAADTYGQPAAAFDFGVHYEQDMRGSRQITAK